MSNLTLKSMLHSNTMWALKAEKGLEFIAAHQPGPYSHQQLAKNYHHSSAEKVTYLTLRMIHLKRSSKLLFYRYKMSELGVDLQQNQYSVMAGNLKHMRL